MSGLYIVSFLCIIFIFFEVETGKTKPYAINYETVEDCLDRGTKDIIWYSNITKLENGNYNARFKLKRPINENSKICPDVRELTSEGYTKIHPFGCQTCGQAWSFISDYLSNLLIAAGLTPQKCAFPAGNYTVNNWNASQSKYLQVPSSAFKKFKTKVDFYERDIKIGCQIFYFEIIPK